MVRLLSCLLIVLQVFGLVLLAAPAFADPQAENISHGYVPKYWSLMASVARTNSLYITGDGSDAASVDVAVAPAIPLNRDYTLSALVEASQDLKAETNDFGRGAITLTKATGYTGLGDRIKLIPRVGLGFPLARDVKATSLQASLRTGSRIEYNSEYLFSKRLGLAGDLGLTRNFHQYDTSIKGDVNTEYMMAEAIELSWSFSDSIALIGTFGHYDALTYQGMPKDFLAHAEELDWQFNPKWIIAVGHSWGVPYASSRKANGQDLNFEMTDESNSMVYAQLTLIL